MSENIINSIILDDSTNLIENADNNKPILFGLLPADAEPIKTYELNVGGIEYPKKHSPKCAICNSPHQTLLEHVYIELGKRPQRVINFFKDHYNAKLNFQQVRTHVKYHCDFNKIETPGLLDYEDRKEELSRWKFRELELALTAILVEINDVRGISAKSSEDILKRAGMIEKLTGKLIIIKQQRDSTIGLPNVFEVLHELHELMTSEEDKRIIREQSRKIQESLN